MSTTNAVPEIWYKSKRVIRTILVVAPTFVIGLNVTLPLVADAFNSPDVPTEVYLWVNVVVGALLVITGILTRIIAIPVVNTWLTKIGAGSVPKHVAENGGAPTLDGPRHSTDVGGL